MSDTNEKTTYGLFGIHFNTTLFAQTIDPLLENRQRNYVDGTCYWVYPIRQVVEYENRIPTVTDVLSQNARAESVNLTDDVMKTLYDDLLDPSVKTISMNGVEYVAYAQRIP
jgi:hypothetical protein